MAKTGAKQRPKSEKQVRLMGILTATAVAAGVMSLGYAWVTSTDAASKVAAATEGAVPIVVAAGEIGAGSVIEEDMLKVVEIPAAYCAAGTASSVDEIAGRTAVVDIHAGAQLSPSSMTGDEAASLADALEPGMVAYSVAVDAESGVASNVRQGDLVDIVTRENPARTVLSGVKVMALDASLSETGETGYSTITVALSPTDAAALQTVQAETPTRFVLAATADNPYAEEVEADGGAGEQVGAQAGEKEAL